VGGGQYNGCFTGNIIPDSPNQPVILSINGALPYETSVTLDGMPLINNTPSGNPGGGFDLSGFPMPLFTAADIVRGPGANAPSILDSIGGSFVVHPPASVDKDTFTFSISNDPYGGTVANGKVALRFGKLSATIVYGLNNSPGPLGNQEVITATPSTPLAVNGQPFNSGGFVDYYPIPQYPDCFCAYQNSLLYCCNQVSTTWVQHNGGLAVSYAFTPSLTAQVFYAGSSANVMEPAYKYLVDFTPDAGYTGSLAPGFYSYLSAQGYAPHITQSASLLEEKITAYLKRGVVRFAALQNNSFWQVFYPGFDRSSGQYTVWGTGTYADGSSAVFNGTSELLTFSPVSVYEGFRSNNRDLLGSYASQIGSKTSADISYVMSYYNRPLTANILAGTTPISFGSPSANSESTRELRLHAAMELTDKLALELSWFSALGTYHVQNPSDPTGNTFTDSLFRYNAPRVAATWRINQNSVIRASVGGGYALPSLDFLEGTDFVSCATVCTNSITNLNLKPEESFGFDIGTDVRLHRNTVLSLDLYRTNLYGQFVSLTNLTGTYNGLPLYTTEESNASKSRFEGINLDIRHDVPRGIYWQGALGLTRGYVVSVPPGFYDAANCTNCVNTYIVPGMNFDGYFQSTVPYANGFAQIGYRWNPDTYVDLTPTYYGNNNGYYEPAFVEVDGHVGYPLTKNVRLVATFRNITGIYDRNYQYVTPTLGAPNITGPPSPLFGIPYGPRTAIISLEFHD
jgi:outer membrane receptor protein involved in Fe transport